MDVGEKHCRGSEVDFLVRDGTKPSDEVILAVAEAIGTHPLDLPPLCDAVNPDVLDRLYREATTVKVEFEYAGCTAMISSDGLVAFRNSSEAKP